jgi:hypothetical protein
LTRFSTTSCALPLSSTSVPCGRVGQQGAQLMIRGNNRCWAGGCRRPAGWSYATNPSMRPKTHAACPGVEHPCTRFGMAGQSAPCSIRQSCLIPAAVLH